MGLQEELEEAFSQLRDPGHLRYCPICCGPVDWSLSSEGVPLSHSWVRLQPQTQSYVQHWVYCDNPLCQVLSLFSVIDQKERGIT